MNAAEIIQAAIDNLETLKAESTRAPWHYWTDDLTGYINIWHDQEVRTHIASVGHYGEPRVYRDAELIVTLHRTIDAQLAILRHQGNRGHIAAFNLVQVPESDSGFWGAVGLARAILGSDADDS